MAMDIKNMNPLGAIGILGTILMIIGVFLAWMTVDNIVAPGSTTYTGMDIFNQVDGIKSFDYGYASFSGMKYTFVPMAALVCGIISLLLMILPTFMNMSNFQQINNILGIVALVLSVVVVIFGLLFGLQEATITVMGAETKLGLFAGHVTAKAGYWLTMVGAVITLVGGAMPIVKNKLL